MSLENKIRDLATRVATECNTLRNEHGTLTALNTTNKSSLVAAVNELNTAISSFNSIDDVATNTTTTWSSTKVTQEIGNALAGLVNGAPAALDTLNELATAIQSNDGDITTLLSGLGNRVRTDTAVQGLTAEQANNARTNIGAASTTSLGNTERNLVADFEAALA